MAKAVRGTSRPPIVMLWVNALEKSLHAGGRPLLLLEEEQNDDVALQNFGLSNPNEVRAEEGMWWTSHPQAAHSRAAAS